MGALLVVLVLVFVLVLVVVLVVVVVVAAFVVSFSMFPVTEPKKLQTSPFQSSMQTQETSFHILVKRTCQQPCICMVVL